MEHQPASGPPLGVALDEYRTELLVELATHRTAASERQRVIETLLATNHRLLELVERLATRPDDTRPPHSVEDHPTRSDPAPTEPDHKNRETS